MPDVRCAFGLVGQRTRRSSLTPSGARLPAFWRPVLKALYRPSVIRPAVTSPVPGVSSAAGSSAPAAFFGARPGKSNTQTISRASALPVLTTRRHVVTSLSGRAPFLAAHFASPGRVSARAAGATEACNAQLCSLAPYRRIVGPQPSPFPKGYRPSSRHAIWLFRHAHQLQRSHLTPACSGLAALAADARR